MAKNQNTFAKRQREMRKKEKAQLKRERKKNRKLSPAPETANTSEEDGIESDSEAGTVGDDDSTDTEALDAA